MCQREHLCRGYTVAVSPSSATVVYLSRTMSVLLAQNCYQMLNTGIGESCPQRTTYMKSLRSQWCIFLFTNDQYRLKRTCYSFKKVQMKLIRLWSDYYILRTYKVTLLRIVAQTTVSLGSLDKTSSASATDSFTNLCSPQWSDHHTSHILKRAQTTVRNHWKMWQTDICTCTHTHAATHIKYTHAHLNTLLI